MGKLRSVLLACAMLGFAASASAQQVVYRTTFRNAADSRWSHKTVSATPSGRTFLGPFNRELLTLRLADLPPHTSVTVGFDLFAIGSWAGSDAKGGPDLWEFGEAGAARQLSSTFATTGGTQSYPSPYPGGVFSRGSWAFESNTLGYSADSVFHIQRTFTHNAGELVLEFRSSGERWGLDNVEVSVVPTGLAAYAWGNGQSGQLGNELTEPQPVPRGVGGVTDVIAVAGGDYHSLALSADGTLWGWGDNSVGQTATGNGPMPRRITTPGGQQLPSFSAIASGPFSAVALGPAGTLWTWGANESGQSGLGYTSPFSPPTQIPKMDSFVAVAAGYQHSVALRADGSIWTWGRNDYGQLGLGFTGVPITSPRLVGTLRSFGANAVAIASGEQHVIAIDSRGRVWGWGYNGSGPVGGTARFVASPRQLATGGLALAAGHEHTLALLEDGRVASWGNNLAGQLGTGTSSKSGYVQNGAGADLTGVVAIGASGLQSFTSVNQDLWGFGRNDYGQLGTGSYAAAEPLPRRVRASTGMIAPAGGLWHGLGVAPAPVASAAPSEQSFGEQAVGSAQSFRTITLTNAGAHDLLVFSVDVWGGDFSRTSTDCGAVLPPAASCRTEVAFRPSAGGISSGMLQFRTNTPAMFVNVALSGAGASRDMTGPEVVIISPRNGEVYKTNDPVVASYFCTDASGVAGCAGPVAAGAAVDTTIAGSGSFAVTATDNAGNSSTHTVSYTVVSPFPTSSDAPVAHSQTLSTAQNAGKAIKLTGSDTNGDPLTYRILTAPEHGSLNGTPPSLTYVPANGYVGGDSFTFVANDGQADSDPATVAIAVVSSRAVTFTGYGRNPATGHELSAEVTFDVDAATGRLVATIRNTSTDDVSEASDVLTAVFFNVANEPTLTPYNGRLTNYGLPGGSSVIGGPDGMGNIGGEWWCAGAEEGPFGARKIISAASFGDEYATANFRGPNLGGSPYGNVDGFDFGITSAGDDPTTPVDEPVIQNSVVVQTTPQFTFNPRTDISSVSFQYGASTTDPNVAGRAQ